MKIFKNRLLLSVVFVLFIIVIPSFIFSIYQYSNVTNEEQVIDDVYKNQLETILFSINQYSVDVVNNWVIKLNEIYLKDNEAIERALNDFIQKNDFIYQINIKELSNLTSPGIEISKLEKKQNVTTLIETYIKNHQEDINHLNNYLKNDYQKVIGIKQVSQSELTSLIFLIKTYNSPLVGIFTINTDRFIQEILSPKIQEVSENKMNIVVYHNNLEKIIFTNQQSEAMKEIQKSKELWLFPGYYVGIELKGNTLNDLVKKRVRTVIFLVVLFNVLIILGIWLLYYNVKRELELAKIKSDFVSNVSHELRTPLAMISMYSETLLLDRIKNDDKRHEYYEIIHQETTRLNGIVNNILNFSRIENKKRKYLFSRSNLNDIVNDVLKVYKYELLNKGFDYKYKPCLNLEPVNIDSDAVKDAIINILSNAIKYSNENKEIEIVTGESENQQYIEIIDKGIGISEKEQTFIFDKFYRVTEGNLAYKAQGSGLGLSIVKHIMDAHNGKIEVKSKLNQGSSFKLIFTK